MYARLNFVQEIGQQLPFWKGVLGTIRKRQNQFFLNSVGRVWRKVIWINRYWFSCCSKFADLDYNFARSIPLSPDGRIEIWHYSPLDETGNTARQTASL